MTRTKLTKAQRASLDGLALAKGGSVTNDVAGAYGVSLVACRKLAALGLVDLLDRTEYESGRGDFWSWRAEITDAGREALAALQ